MGKSGGYNKDGCMTLVVGTVGMDFCGEGWCNGLGQSLVRIGSVSTNWASSLIRPESLAKAFDPLLKREDSLARVKLATVVNKRKQRPSLP